MTKLIITEAEKKNILNKHYGDVNQQLFDFIKSNFIVYNDVQYHNITDGRGQLIVFMGNIQDIYGDELEEIFKYTNSKKELKDKIVSFLKEDPRIYEILQVKGMSKLIDLLRGAETKEEMNLYTTEIRNQMRINYDRIDGQLNKTVKSFIDFYTK
jgi:hypothetical protein